MAFFGRLNCHFCGIRSAHSKGVESFHCDNCDATNFFDRKGNVIDAPSHITNSNIPGTNAIDPFCRPAEDRSAPDSSPAFCKTCIKNQRIYLETLSNCLPDEDDPKYAECEANLPGFKEQLERRYPQVCASCASKAQSRIHEADTFSMKRSVAENMKSSRDRHRLDKSRLDSWARWNMRMLCRAANAALYVSILVQTVWHAYGCAFLFSAPGLSTDSTENTDLSESPVVPELAVCVKHLLLDGFDGSCYYSLGSVVLRALTTSAMLLWYNPGMIFKWHHAHQIESISGKLQYFQIQLTVLLVRTLAWFFLSNPTTIGTLSEERLLASHGFMILFMLSAQWLSERQLGFEVKTFNTKIMPRPEDEDVLGAMAGPRGAQHSHHASPTSPLALLSRNEKPFPIGSLEPRMSNTHTKSTFGHPSPPSSQPPSSDGDAMDIDSPELPVARPPTQLSFSQTLANQPPRSIYNYGTTQPLGWSAVRNETFRISDDIQAQEQRRRREAEQRSRLKYEPEINTNPFRGTLPPAPMSMERRIRNPPTRLDFRKADPSAQANFMSKMRQSVSEGRSFRYTQAEAQSSSNQPPPPPPPADQTDSEMEPTDDDDATVMTPARERTRGSLDLRPSKWVLQQDLKNQWTGLEDLFGGRSFRITDEHGAVKGSGEGVDGKFPTPEGQGNLSWQLVLGALLAVLAVIWMLPVVRRSVALFLVARIEELGY